MNQTRLAELWSHALRRLEHRGLGDGPIACHIKELLSQIKQGAEVGFSIDTEALDKMADDHTGDVIDNYLVALKPLFPDEQLNQPSDTKTCLTGRPVVERLTF
jgi:hypothetical protein